MEEGRLCGQVAAIVYKNDQNGYTVAKVRLMDGDLMTVVGNMPGLGAGESITAEGTYIEHPQYGIQFSVKSFERSMPTTSASIYEYLASGTVKGIGPKTAQMIVEEYGERSFEIIASQPELLSKIRGISMEKALMIQRSYLQSGILRALIEFLAYHTLPPSFAASLAKRFGGDSVSVIMENPYVLCEEPFSLSFSDADRLAHDFNIDGESPVRVRAALLYELSFNLQSGHVFLPAGKLLEAAEKLCGVEMPYLQEELSNLCEMGSIVREQVGKTDACYLTHVFHKETSAAWEVKRLLSMEITPPKGLSKLLTAEEKKTGLSYADRQREAILKCFSHGISVITGGPGTGKTTALLTLINMLDACGLVSALAAPTGRAADRMSKICGREAKTLHRLLETSPDESGEMVFKRNKSNPLSFDAVIVDEASMLDLNMSASLLEALKPGARLVLVGDGDQLPPVGAGRFFCDLMESGVVPVTRLTEIFRQARESDIIVNAHKINHGEMPKLADNDKDFYFSSCRTAQSAANLASDLVGGRITDRFGIDPWDIQVICPSRRNVCGTEEMNARLQARLNPPLDGKAEVKWGSAIFRQGDRVMQIKNNYDRAWHDAGALQSGAGIYNGDTGVIDSIDTKARLVSVTFDGKTTEYTFNELEELEHAFAITAHKSQGSEYKAVIIPIFDCPSRLLMRNLLYTAVTRAKELLVICGREDMLQSMVVSGNSAKRYGAMKRRIKSDDETFA